MRIPDANVLIYATNADAQHHEASRRWLDGALGGGERVGLAWLPLLAYARLVTRPGLFERPVTPAAAMEQVSDWIAAPSAVIVHPTQRHADILTALVAAVGVGGNLVNDAHLAALSLEHRGRIVTYDGDFARFPDVSCDRPDDLT